MMKTLITIAYAIILINIVIGLVNLYLGRYFWTITQFFQAGLIYFLLRMYDSTD